MNKSPQSRRFWRIFGPILGYWGIRIVAQVIVAMVLVVMNSADIAEIMLSVSEENMTEKIMELSVKMTQIMMDNQNLIVAFIALCTMPMTVFLFKRDRKAEKEAQYPFAQAVSSWQYVWLFLFSTVFCIGINVIIVMSGLAARDTSYLTAAAGVYAKGAVMLLICQGIVVPIAEELMFRGVLFRRCREQMGFWSSAFSVSLFFALEHGTVTQLAYTLVLGLFFAYFYEKYGSLKAPVLLHIMVNVVSVVITKTGVLMWLCSDYTRMAVCVVGCAFTGAVAFVRIQKIEKKMEIEMQI